jgi:hypothetical protein
MLVKGATTYGLYWRQSTCLDCAEVVFTDHWQHENMIIALGLISEWLKAVGVINASYLDDFIAYVFLRSDLRLAVSSLERSQRLKSTCTPIPAINRLRDAESNVGICPPHQMAHF